MRDVNRLDEFYDELKKIHKEVVPDWRFGQFMTNLLSSMQRLGRDPFFPEEEEFIQFVREYFDIDKEEV